MVHVERELLFLRGEEALVVLDRLHTASDATVKTFLIHFETNPVIEGPTQVTAVNADQALHLTTLAPTNVTSRVVDEGGVGQYRLELDASGGQRDAFLHVLQTAPSATRPAAPTVVETATEWTITIGSAEVTLVKGDTSSGGAVRTGAQRHPLSEVVQPADIGPDGPRWR